MDIHVLTVFPQYYRPFGRYGLMARAMEEGHMNLTPWSLRRFTPDDYGEIDDRAYGGKYGMVMKPEPYFRGVEHIRDSRGDGSTLLMAPDGKELTNQRAKDLSKRERIIILTGRYEGVDNRVRENLADDVWSIGSYVTPGGDLPALVLITSVIRHISGVVGNQSSVANDSYQDGLLAPPHYTRPDTYRGFTVPDVLLSGDHKKIEEWRQQQARRRTEQERPELLDDNQADG
ncbi:MAG: tRNA (guanosine(37)-N1)-methyltransferase TrmD [bacterium]